MAAELIKFTWYWLSITESGMGRELGEAALENYTEVKAVHINLTGPPPF